MGREFLLGAWLVVLAVGCALLVASVAYHLDGENINRYDLSINGEYYKCTEYVDRGMTTVCEPVVRTVEKVPWHKGATGG